MSGVIETIPVMILDEHGGVDRSGWLLAWSRSEESEGAWLGTVRVDGRTETIPGEQLMPLSREQHIDGEPGSWPGTWRRRG